MKRQSLSVGVVGSLDVRVDFVVFNGLTHCENYILVNDFFSYKFKFSTSSESEKKYGGLKQNFVLQNTVGK